MENPAIGAASKSDGTITAKGPIRVPPPIPSGWSAAIDQAAAGTMVGDDEGAPKRLIVVSAGNTKAEIEAHRILHQDEFPIEDPAQAWNALTVGGYTDLIHITEKGYEGWTPMVTAGSLNPHSRTSATWPLNSPIKPEVVMEAGNRAVSPAQTEVHTVGSLRMCTTGHDLTSSPLVPFQATSAAAAQAARLAARLTADHQNSGRKRFVD